MAKKSAVTTEIVAIPNVFTVGLTHREVMILTFSANEAYRRLSANASTNGERIAADRYRAVADKLDSFLTYPEVIE
jgi:hypothetical protein